MLLRDNTAAMAGPAVIVRRRVMVITEPRDSRVLLAVMVSVVVMAEVADGAEMPMAVPCISRAEVPKLSNADLTHAELLAVMPALRLTAEMAEMADRAAAAVAEMMFFLMAVMAAAAEMVEMAELADRADGAAMLLAGRYTSILLASPES